MRQDVLGPRAPDGTTSRIRNVAIVAHVDAGKTTTTEQLLYVCGCIRKPGSVDAGTSRTDALPEERARGITIRAAATALPWRGHVIHLIDTPGHVDFAPEVGRALAVLDGAVLIVSAADGVQPHTERLWAHLDRLGLPVLIAVNKMDQPAADHGAALDEVRAVLSPHAVPVQEPAWDGGAFAGMRDLVGGAMWRWVGHDARAVSLSAATDPPAPGPMREALVEAVAEVDDDIADVYLRGAPVPAPQLHAALRVAVLSRRCFPVLWTSAARGIGLQPLLDAVVDLLPAPPGRPDGEFAARVFKLDRHPELGKVAHVCVLSGSVAVRQAVRNAARGAEEKVTLIRAVQGAPRGDLPRAEAGDVVALFGLSRARNGDALGAAGACSPGGLADPVMAVRVHVDGGRRRELAAALAEVEDEDPGLRLEWSPDHGEAKLAVMGPVHLEYLQSVLQTRYGLTVSFTAPEPDYCETIGEACEGWGEFTGIEGDPHFGARVRVRVTPLPPGTGVRWRDLTRDLPPEFASGAAAALPSLAHAGPIAGRRVVDVEVALLQAVWSAIRLTGQTRVNDLRVATERAVRTAMAACPHQRLLEPILAYRVSAPESSASRLVGYLASLGASVEVGEAAGERIRLRGEVAAAATWEVPLQVAALTHGRGVWDARLTCYRDADPARVGPSSR